MVKISIVSILGVIVLIAAALAIAGLGADANRLTSSLVIRQKPAAIWPWLYQSDKVKQWVSWLAEVRDDGKAEPVPGGKSVWVMQDRNNNNAPMEITAVVDSVEPPRKLAVSLSAPRPSTEPASTRSPAGPMAPHCWSRTRATPLSNRSPAS